MTGLVSGNVRQSQVLTQRAHWAKDKLVVFAVGKSRYGDFATYYQASGRHVRLGDKIPGEAWW